MKPMIPHAGRKFDMIRFSLAALLGSRLTFLQTIVYVALNVGIQTFIVIIIAIFERD